MNRGLKENVYEREDGGKRKCLEWEGGEDRGYEEDMKEKQG